MTIEEMREEFKKIRERAHYEHSFTDKEYLEKCSNYLKQKGIIPEVASPEQWLKAAENIEFGCGRCARTGRFITYVENGVPKGPGGECFRCGGKGYQNDSDHRRNWGYDMFGVRVY